VVKIACLVKFAFTHHDAGVVGGPTNRRYKGVTVRPDTAETLTSRGVALVFEVEDICKATSLVQ
jgi:hypothetical protein